MIIKKCDVCNTEVDNLNKIEKGYRVKNIDEICDNCLHTINVRFRILNDNFYKERTKLIKQTIENMIAINKS